MQFVFDEEMVCVPYDSRLVHESPVLQMLRRHNEDTMRMGEVGFGASAFRKLRLAVETLSHENLIVPCIAVEAIEMCDFLMIEADVVDKIVPPVEPGKAKPYLPMLHTLLTTLSYVNIARRLSCQARMHASLTANPNISMRDFNRKYYSCARSIEWVRRRCLPTCDCTKCTQMKSDRLNDPNLLPYYGPSKKTFTRK